MGHYLVLVIKHNMPTQCRGQITNPHIIYVDHQFVICQCPTDKGFDRLIKPNPVHQCTPGINRGYFDYFYQ